MHKKLVVLTTVWMLAMAPCTADELAFAKQETRDSTIYNLQLTGKQGVQTVWSREVALINEKKPDDYCSLLSWARNEHGLLAIVYFNESFGRLLQFDPANKILAQIDIGSKWIQHEKREEKIQLVPPDRIEVTSGQGILSETIIRDGKLYNPDGEPFVEDPLIAMLAAQAQKQTSKADINAHVAKPSVVANGTTPTKLEPLAAVDNTNATPSTPWIVTTVLIVAAGGLLWLLLKRRS